MLCFWSESECNTDILKAELIISIFLNDFPSFDFYAKKASIPLTTDILVFMVINYERKTTHEV